jgi:hypothetical protein
MTYNHSYMVNYENLNPDSIKELLSHYGIQINCSVPGVAIPHSYWGAPEAGRIREQLYIRGDTPIHSILHESCHYVCMPAELRALKQVDAKGSAMEENATCYLQILLAEHIDGYSRTQLMKDMDAWGYSFRLGSANSWFTQDAEEVQQWLISQKIINAQGKPTWELRNKIFESRPSNENVTQHLS